MRLRDQNEPHTFLMHGSSKKGANSFNNSLPPSRTSTQIHDFPSKYASEPEYILKHMISPWPTGVSCFTSMFDTCKCIVSSKRCLNKYINKLFTTVLWRTLAFRGKKTMDKIKISSRVIEQTYLSRAYKPCAKKLWNNPNKLKLQNKVYLAFSHQCALR